MDPQPDGQKLHDADSDELSEKEFRKFQCQEIRRNKNSPFNTKKWIKGEYIASNIYSMTT